MADVVKIGLLGCGTVGGSLVGLIHKRRSAIEHTTGITLEIVKVAVRSASRERSCPLDPDTVTTDASQVVQDPSVDIVVEVIGGIEPARTLILDALAAGKPVVTANKELLANCGAELYAAADKAGVDLLFEASAAGAIPIVRPLRESLLAEDLSRVMGIVNGTTNFILSKMSLEGSSYGDALAEAQRLGYAERDPTADVEGFDAGAKAAIMAGIAFGARVVAGDVYHEGISQLTAADISFAKRLGYSIKLLAIAEKFGTADDGTSEIGVRVHPTMVPNDHPLASVNGSFNAVFVEGAASGELMFYGRGAGGDPTASAVLGDVVDAALNLRQGNYRRVPSGPKAKIRSIDQLESAFYLNVEVEDLPGVLSQVAGVIGGHGLSIESMEQHGTGSGARLVFITHAAAEHAMQGAIAELKKTSVVKGVAGFLRVLGE